MTENSFEYIISVLKGQRPQLCPDWYETTGFLIAHRIAGLFYNRAKKIKAEFPYRAENILRAEFEKQRRQNFLMREEIEKLFYVFAEHQAEYVFLKGGVLSNLSEENAVYKEGERASNDIDILVHPGKIVQAEQALKSFGYIQGFFNGEEIIPFSRREIISRRLNRGETAPFIKKTDNPEFPIIEVDVNFSLGNIPGDRADLIAAMLDTRMKYEGKVPLYVPNEEMFFLHLIFHQYKESSLLFMVERRKDLDLYKLADIYYLWKGGAFDKQKLRLLSEQFNAQSEIGAVLYQAGQLFADNEVLSAAKTYGIDQPDVIDYKNKKSYFWISDTVSRICSVRPKKYLLEKSHVSE